MCLQSRFRDAFTQYMRDNHASEKVKFTNADDCAISLADYVIDEELHVCKSCLGHAQAGCCDEYHADNRTRRKAFLGMRIVRQPIK